MASNFAAKRQDDLNRFYTRTSVGELLVSQLTNFKPDKILDLGAGEGSLSVAVAQRWSKIKAVTVDVDPSIVSNLHDNIESTGCKDHHHHIHDVFDPDLPSALARHNSFDLAVCNPPFFRPKWNRAYAQILQSADLATACQSTADVTAEIIFLAQNLRLLRDGGRMVLIAPDGLITGWRMSAFRRTILQTHRVDSVIQLPSHSFHDTEARCFILTLTKNAGPSQNVQLFRFCPEEGLSEPLSVASDLAQQRMDFDFHNMNCAGNDQVITLRAIGAEIKRGSIDSVGRKQSNQYIFHTTDYSSSSDGLFAFEVGGTEASGSRPVIAQPGDILMARVDRSLHTKIGLVVAGQAPITDCVYRVRVPVEYQHAVFNALRSPDGASTLLAATKGVSARLLGKADLLDLPIHIPT